MQKKIILFNLIFLVLTVGGNTLASDDFQREFKIHDGELLHQREDEITHGSQGTSAQINQSAELRAWMNNPRAEPRPWTQEEINNYNNLVDPKTTKLTDINTKVTNCPPRPKSEWESKNMKYLVCKKHVISSDKNLQIERLQNPSNYVIFNTSDVNCSNKNGTVCNIKAMPTPTPSAP